MSESPLPHDFGSFEGLYEKRPGPIRTLVDSWEREWREEFEGTSSSEFGQKWGDRIAWGTATAIADRLDLAIVETAASIRQENDEADPGNALIDRLNHGLRKVVIVVDLGGIRDLDEIATFFARVGSWISDLSDKAWNLRNSAIPYKPGDDLYDEGIEQ